MAGSAGGGAAEQSSAVPPAAPGLLLSRQAHLKAGGRVFRPVREPHRDLVANSRFLIVDAAVGDLGLGGDLDVDLLTTFPLLGGRRLDGDGLAVVGDGSD